jgi:small subunit ribosomal protein S4
MEKKGRNAPPGMHALGQRKSSPYGVRLREKQKVKRYYGLFERQFRRYFAAAQKATGNTGEALLTMLERRLDNVVCKAGFCASRKAARIAVGHGHFTLNGRPVDRPGVLVKIGDRIGVKSKESSEKMVRAVLEARNLPVQPWMNLDPQKLEITVNALPTREDVQIPVEETLIVEFCSR